MYNGVGLTTARGSGTNGYVQTNMAFIRKSRLETKVKTDEDIRKMEAMLNRKPNQEILSHQAKRKVEVKVLELREAMEDDGKYDEEEIEAKCVTFREMLLNKEGFLDTVEAKSSRSHETHQLAAQNEMKNKKAFSAFGIREDYTPGAAFTEEYQLARVEDARKRTEAREQEKIERQKRLAKVIVERKEKELADKVKYNWVNSDDEDYEKKKEERRRQKKARREEKERPKTPEKEVKQERPDSDMETDVKQEREASPKMRSPSPRRRSHSPRKRRSPSPKKRRSPSPKKRRSRSPRKRRSRSRSKSPRKSRDDDIVAPHIAENIKKSVLKLIPKSEKKSSPDRRRERRRSVKSRSRSRDRRRRHKRSRSRSRNRSAERRRRRRRSRSRSLSSSSSSRSRSRSRSRGRKNNRRSRSRSKKYGRRERSYSSSSSSSSSSSRSRSRGRDNRGRFKRERRSSS